MNRESYKGDKSIYPQDFWSQSEKYSLKLVTLPNKGSIRGVSIGFFMNLINIPLFLPWASFGKVGLLNSLVMNQTQVVLLFWKYEGRENTYV